MKSTDDKTIKRNLEEEALKLEIGLKSDEVKYFIHFHISKSGYQRHNIIYKENGILKLDLRLRDTTAAFLVNEGKALLITDEEFQSLKKSGRKK